MKVSRKHVFTTAISLGFVALVAQSQLSSLIEIPPGGISFGPETFTRSTGKPAIIVRDFSVANPNADYFIQIQNGENGINRVSSAVIKLNGNVIVSPNDLDQSIPGLSRGVVLQSNNTLEIELRSIPDSKLILTIRRAMLNPTIANPQNDLVGNNNLEGIGLVWDREESAADYVIFRSDSISGPFVEVGRVKTGSDRRTNAVDITPDARTKTLCYKVEAMDTSGNTTRLYEPVCVPHHITNPHELENLSKRIFPETFCLNETQFTDTFTLSLNDIRTFLQKWDSFLIRQDKDVDGVMIDPAAIIADAAITSGINPQVILGTLERESSAVTRTSPPSNTTLRLMVGFDLAHPTTIREQIRDGTAQYRRDFDRLTRGEPTPSGWQIGVPQTTLDGVVVTPRNKVSAGMFSYDPEAGVGWGGQQEAVGGNFLFCWRWATFEFPIPPQPVALNSPTDITSNSLKLSWTPPAFPDPDFLQYKIFRSTTPSVTENSTLVATIINQSQTELTDTGLTSNTAFFYRVFVIDQDNLSAGSNEVSAETISGEHLLISFPFVQFADTIAFGIVGQEKIAQSFKLTQPSKISRVDVIVWRGVGAGDGVRMRLSSSLNDTLATSNVVPASTLGTTLTTDTTSFTFPPLEQPTLPSNQTIFFILERTGFVTFIPTNSFFVNFRAGGFGATYPDGMFHFFNNFLGQWVNQSDFDFFFEIFGF